MWELRPELIGLTPAQRLFHCPRPIIGLTGGMGCGKSTALACLQEYAITLSADALIKKIYALPATITFLQEVLPEAVHATTSPATINWEVLRTQFLAQKSLAQKIENYLYAQLPAMFNQELATAAASHHPSTAIVFEVPLLFECHWDTIVDQTIAVVASTTVQAQRLTTQRQLPPSTREAFLKRQLPLAAKAAQANFTIKNDGSLAELHQQCHALAAQLFCPLV